MTDQPGVRLSRRQAQIIRAIARGDTYRTVAQKLAISPATVSYHVGQLQAKLHTASLPALVGPQGVITLMVIFQTIVLVPKIFNKYANKLGWIGITAPKRTIRSM